MTAQGPRKPVPVGIRRQPLGREGMFWIFGPPGPLRFLLGGDPLRCQYVRNLVTILSRIYQQGGGRPAVNPSLAPHVLKLLLTEPEQAGAPISRLLVGSFD